ncbi:hypothetical protein T492DRAFT_888761 [Pavlovales sp. CCMP2436]|nr:hypothetical protein T492DRAFT_888761 [Pavlovales sp. CCMP2436]
MDASRPVQYESCAAGAYTDIICPMYPSALKLESMGTAEGQVAPYFANGRKYPSPPNKESGAAL